MNPQNDSPNHPAGDEIPTIGPHQFVGWFCEPDDLLGWRMTPGQQAWFVKPGIRTWLSINKDGFRGQEFPGRKAPGEQRILLLGDSFGVAIEVQEEETFPSMLQQHLITYSSNRAASMVMLNASVAGYGTEQELLYLQKKATELEPDIILLAFHFGSDPIENNQHLRDKIHWRFVKLPRPYLETGADGELELVNYPPQPAEIRKGWNHYYDFLPKKLIERRLLLNNDPTWIKDTTGDQLRRLFGRVQEAIYKRRQKYALRRTVPVDAKIYCAYPDIDFEESWQHTARLIAALQHETETLGARLIVANICTKEQIIPGFLEGRLPAGVQKRAEYDPLYPNLRLAEILNILKIPNIDLIPAFQSAQKAGKMLFHEHDLHWNPEGHQLAAETIWKSLVEYLK